MAVGCSYNCTELPNHEKLQCGEFPKGGISSIGILECDHTITDFSSMDQLQTAIDTNDLTLIEPVRATLPEPAEILGVNPSACGATDILDGFDFTFTWQDFNVSNSNVDFYNALNQRQTFLLWFQCDEGKLRVVQSAITFMAKNLTPESNKEKQVFNVTASWSDGPDGIPPIFSAPTGIFNQGT